MVNITINWNGIAWQNCNDFLVSKKFLLIPFSFILLVLTLIWKFSTWLQRIRSMYLYQNLTFSIHFSSLVVFLNSGLISLLCCKNFIAHVSFVLKERFSWVEVFVTSIFACLWFLFLLQISKFSIISKGNSFRIYSPHFPRIIIKSNNLISHSSFDSHTTYFENLKQFDTFS